MAADLRCIRALKHCPDKEGIKTYFSRLNKDMPLPLKHCPDKEGIKTKVLWLAFLSAL